MYTNHSAPSAPPFPGPQPGRLLVRGGRVLNVFTGELLDQDIAIENGRIAALLSRDDASAEAFDEIVDAADHIVVPGYVEPHAHLGLMAEPIGTLEQMARTGTTALVADTYGLMVALGDDELVHVLDHMQQLPTYVRWFLAPHARSFLVDEQQLFSPERVERFLARDDVVAIGELTRWPSVAQGDPDLIAKIQRALRAGKRVEGHGAGASPPRLQRLAWHGVTSDHEAITPEQVVDRLRLGFYTMLRHSSLRPDLPHLLAAVQSDLQHSNRLMLTADGPTPGWVQTHGYLDHLIRLALEGGVSPAAAYRMASLNPAMYYRIEHDVGAIAPGRRADLNVLSSLNDPTPVLVLAGGRVVARNGALVAPFPKVPWDEFAGLRRSPGERPWPELFDFEDGENNPVPTLELVHAVLLRQAADGPTEPLRAAVYDWHGRWITRAFVHGFAERIGGLATSYNPAYQLTVLGHEASDMALAAARVLDSGGGLCLVEKGEVVFELPLERGGLFTELPWSDLVDKLAVFEKLMRDRGYWGHELLYTLFFFGFDSLPDYRLTVRGVWDVRQQKTLAPPLRLRDDSPKEGAASL